MSRYLAVKGLLDKLSENYTVRYFGDKFDYKRSQGEKLLLYNIDNTAYESLSMDNWAYNLTMRFTFYRRSEKDDDTDLNLMTSVDDLIDLLWQLDEYWLDMDSVSTPITWDANGWRQVQVVCTLQNLEPIE